MDVREKLVELLNEVQETDELLKQLKNAPITIYKEEPSIELVQEWISVDERLPDKPMKCLVYTKRGDCGGYEIAYYNKSFYLQYSNVTHWMPLPTAPKGE